MNLSLYLLIGLLLALVLKYRSNIFSQVLLFGYWLVVLLWSLKLISPFTYNEIIWSTTLNISFTYHIDGLARLFSLMVSGIGVLIFIYAAIYAHPNQNKLSKLLSLLQVFAISMLGIVLTDNTVVLFMAWELTTITSYLLIQFNPTDKKANQAAFNGMFISVLGGLAMLASFIIMQQQIDSWSIQIMLHHLTTSSPNIIIAFWLIILGAITKSAQFPFYFWLPGAMKAPTPVSAYLHSATMVNAGIYLLARFHPLFSPMAVWYASLAFFGISTMVISGVLSLFQRDLKSILAYTTLFSLGSMVYLLASDQWLSIEAMMLFLLFHALYKAAAFMWIGSIDLSYGTRDIFKLRGIGKEWFLGSIVAVISFSAMAGLPPFFGFIVKEMLYEAKLAAPSISYGLIGLSIISSMLIAAVSFKVLYYWFTGTVSIQPTKKIALGLLCPLILSLLILALSVLEPYISPLINHAASSVTPQESNFVSTYSFANTALGIITILGGLLIFYLSQLFRHKIASISWPKNLTPDIIFEKKIALVLAFGRWFTYITQRQSLTTQLVIVFSALLVWILTAFYAIWGQFPQVSWSNRSWSIVVLSILILLTSISFLCNRRFIINMVSFAVLGLLMSALFVLQGAPDVAMTQLLVEILSVIILVIALRKSSVNTGQSSPRNQRIIHAILSILIGLIVCFLLLFVTNVPFNDFISHYYITNSLPKAYGHNVVNVILVDFRVLDTFGEALVILATSLAIYLIVQTTKRSKKTDHKTNH